MKNRSLWFMAGTLAVAVAMISCGGSQPASETPAPGAPSTAAGKAVDPATAGSVTGMIKLDGTPPRMRPINMAAEPNCVRSRSGAPALVEDVVVGDGGTLQNVVVYLKGDFNQYSFPPASTPVAIDQNGCQYVAHVVGVRTGQPLHVTNSDMTVHNIHPTPANNREWNESQPPGAPAIEQSFAREEVAVPVKCNVHPWMKAYVAVFSSPYFHVTGKDGSFTLQNVPPGTYTVTAWHELYGTMEQSVTVAASEKKTVDFAFKATSGSD